MKLLRTSKPRLFPAPTDPRDVLFLALSGEWRNGNLICIIIEMMMRLPLKRLTATLLPISFIWLFAACVSICERESEEARSKDQVSSPVEIQDESDCKGCPLSSLPKATIPDRTLSRSDLQTHIAVAPVIFSVDSPHDRTGVVIRRRELSSADPPFQRIQALRI